MSTKGPPPPIDIKEMGRALTEAAASEINGAPGTGEWAPVARWVRRVGHNVRAQGLEALVRLYMEKEQCSHSRAVEELSAQIGYSERHLWRWLRPTNGDKP